MAEIWSAAQKVLDMHVKWYILNPALREKTFFDN
jgi:hypothetical protein